MADLTQSNSIVTIQLPDDVMDWFANVTDSSKLTVIAAAMRDYYARTVQNERLMEWLIDMDYKIVFDDYGVEMVCIHPAAILLTDDPDKLPAHIISLLDKQVSYTNFDIFVNDNGQFSTAPKSDVQLEAWLDTTGRTYITGAIFERYSIRDCLNMGRLEMNDMSRWFAVPKHFFTCV